MYFGRSPVHSGNVALVLNPSSGHVSSQFNVLFDEGITLIPSLHSTTILVNLANLASEFSESVRMPYIDSSKLWFNQARNDDDEATSVFDAAFHR